MTWLTTADVDHFLAEAGQFLRTDPVASNVLLTEACFWQRLADRPEARFGWWVRGGVTRAAFVDVPDHSPVCSLLDDASVHDLPAVLDSDRVAVDGRDERSVTAAWRAHGRTLDTAARLTLLRLDRLDGLTARPAPEGSARLADASDLPLLCSWFRLFQERHPDDASDPAFVVDHPIADEGVVIWEVNGAPVAMCSRTPREAGMVRMGLAFQPDGGDTYAEAAFDAGCARAAQVADHVLVLAGSPELTASYRSRGFEHELDRVLLQQADGRAAT